MKHPSDSTEFYMLAPEGFEKMIMHTVSARTCSENGESYRLERKDIFK